MLNDQDINKLTSVFGTKADFDGLTKMTNDLMVSVDSLTKTTNDLTVSVDIISKTTLKILETMATKAELNIIKTDLTEVKTDLKSFKTETRENFDKLEKNLKENEESVGAVVKDYHPHIITLEEKVFGSSTLAES